jgi:hypothetical protein
MRHAGYGLGVNGLAVDWLPEARRSRMTLRWLATSNGSLQGTGQWLREEQDAVVVGWGGYAEYRFELRPFPEARASLAGITEEQAALGLVLSVLPLCLPLLGLEPLHGSAVAWGGRAVLLLGDSGAGKSSLASRLAADRFGFLSDDACAIDRDGLLWPGPPLLARRTPEGAWPVVGAYDHKTVVAPPGHRAEPVHPRASFVLSPGSGAPLRIRALGSGERLTALLRHVRAPRLLPARRRPLQLAIAARLAVLPVWEVTYEHGLHSVAEVATALAECAAARDRGAA